MESTGMRSRIFTLVLLIGIAFTALLLVPRLAGLRGAGNNQGYEPEQPVAYSHRLHAGELQIDCQYCHSGARRSRYAGIPSADVCMNCHSYIKAPRSAVRAEELAAEKEGRSPERVVSSELAKIYQALALGEGFQPITEGEGLQPAVQHKPEAIRWQRIHQLPDFVYFDHRPHVAAGVQCQKCHGPIETMEKVRQMETLSMGWCIDCHRDPSQKGGSAADPVAPTDCVSCHY
jgi:hypothetical protein